MPSLARRIAGASRTSRSARAAAAGWSGAVLVGFGGAIAIAAMAYLAYGQSGSPLMLGAMLAVLVLAAAWIAFAGSVADLTSQHARDIDAGILFERLGRGEGPKRPYALYLRPFAATNEIDEQVMSPFAAGMPILSFANAPARYELEQQIERATRAIGPLVALGEPLEHVGAGRVRVADDAWQEAVKLLTRHASLIILLPSSRPGTLWEIEHILESDLVERTVMVDPPNIERRKADRYRQEDEWALVREAFSRRGYEIAPDSKVGQLVFYGAGKSPRITARLDLDAEDNILAFFRKVLARDPARLKPNPGPTPEPTAGTQSA